LEVLCVRCINASKRHTWKKIWTPDFGEYVKRYRVHNVCLYICLKPDYPESTYIHIQKIYIKRKGLCSVKDMNLFFRRETA